MNKNEFLEQLNKVALFLFYADKIGINFILGRNRKITINVDTTTFVIAYILNFPKTEGVEIEVLYSTLPFPINLTFYKHIHLPSQQS